LSHLRYSDGGVDSTPACTIPTLDAEECALSDVPTREASLRASPSASIRASPTPPSLWSHGSLGAGPAFFIAIPQTGASPAPKRSKPTADPWSAPCAACCAPITGAVFMGGGRAYCSAAACQKSRGSMRCAASALAAVAPARMGFTPVGLLCGTAAEVAPHPRRAVSTQAKSIERSRRRPWKPTRARSEAWLRESKNCSRESTSSLAAERSSRAPGPALPLVLLPSRLLRARYRRGRRCRCARTCMFTYPHAPCGLCLLAYRVYSP
jgi:hypothetical protein